MNRGDVYRTRLRLPDRTVPGQFADRNKYVVMLRQMPAEADIPFLIASTYNPARPPRPFEVLVGVAHGFDHDTVIDCRWPYTLPKAWFNAAAPFHALTRRDARGQRRIGGWTPDEAEVGTS